MSYFEIQDIVQDRMLKSRELVLGFKITGNATPASKVHSVDLPAVAYLRSEGKTATADAIEDVSGTVVAPNDAAGKFAILLDASKLADTMDDLVDVRVVGKPSETATATVTKYAVTSGGNLVFDVDSSANLSSANFDAYAIIKYRSRN